IVSANVRSSSDSDGTTYRPDILYRYRFNNREYQSNRLGLGVQVSTGSSSSSHSWTNQFRTGTRATCYVDPNDPTFAALERGFTPSLLMGLIPLAFVFFGFIGLRVTSRNRIGGATGMIQSQPWQGSTITLAGKGSPLTNLLVIIAIAAFWNGIVSVFAA